MKGFLLTTVAAFLSLSLSTSSAFAQGGKRGDKLVRELGEEVETKQFQDPHNLREALGLLNELTATKGLKAVFTVDVRAFREDNPEFVPWDAPIQLATFPRQTALANIVSAISQQLPVEAIFLIRGSTVEITTKRAAGKDVLYNQPVLAVFSQVPLVDALGELTDQSGVSINLDPQAKDKAQTSVSARFRNDVALQDAVRMLVEMADLKLVYLPTGLFVTTAAQAEKMNKELRQQYDVRPGDAQSPLSPPLPPAPRGAAGASAPAPQPAFLVAAFAQDEDGVKSLTVPKDIPKDLYKGRPTNPLVIDSAEQLKKTFTNEDTLAAITKEVDFEKQKILVFGWSGSGGDKLTFTSGKEKVTFLFTHGLTRDFRQHFRAFTMPRDMAFEVKTGKK